MATEPGHETNRFEEGLTMIGRPTTKSMAAAIGLSIVLAAPAAEAACGCTSMIVRWNDGTSGTYCSADQNAPLGCQWTGGVGTGGCTAPARPFNCTLGPIEPVGNAEGNFGWAFEVFTVLTVGSDPADCPEGQANSATITKNGVLQVNPHIFDDEPPAGDYDFAGGLRVEIVSDTAVPHYGAMNEDRLVLGADDYTEPSEVKVHDQEIVRWVDTPLITVGAGENWTEKSQFLDYVKPSSGADPSCWCLFTLEHGWNAGVQTEASVTLDQSHNCVIEPVEDP